MSQRTAANDVAAGEQNCSPDRTVQGSDGKTYAKRFSNHSSWNDLPESDSGKVCRFASFSDCTASAVAETLKSPNLGDLPVSPTALLTLSRMGPDDVEDSDLESC
ncbi:MAG: hypothetical protein ACTHVY_09015 [Brevibacterium yomogidense]